MFCAEKDECSLLLGARGRGPAPARRRRKQPGLGAGRHARLACAACFLLAWVAQLGWLAHYFSRPVLVGYIHGVAVVLVCGQLGKLLGVDIDATKPIGQLVDAIQELGNASGTTVLVSAIALGALLVARFFLPRLPAALIVVPASILVSWAVGLEAHGVAVVGSIPSGVPSFSLPRPPLGDAVDLVPAAIGIFLVWFADGILTVRSFPESSTSTSGQTRSSSTSRG
jgi:SulP family sulfate permease